MRSFKNVTEQDIIASTDKLHRLLDILQNFIISGNEEDIAKIIQFHLPGFTEGANIEVTEESPVVIEVDTNDKFKLEVEATMPEGEDITIPPGTYESGQEFVDAIIAGLENHTDNLEDFVTVQWLGNDTGSIKFISNDIGLNSWVILHYPDEDTEAAIEDMGFDDMDEVEERHGQVTENDLLYELEMIADNQVRVVGEFGNLWDDESTGGDTVTDEQVTANYDNWVNLDQTFIERDTVTVTSDDGETTYNKDTDYRINYEGGKIYTISDGSITDGETLLASYDYRGTSNYVDIEGHETISLMLRLDEEADIAFYTSPDNEHWYFNENITEKLPGGQTGELSVSRNFIMGAKYVRLASNDDVMATATIQAKT